MKHLLLTCYKFHLGILSVVDTMCENALKQNGYHPYSKLLTLVKLNLRIYMVILNNNVFVKVIWVFAWNVWYCMNLMNQRITIWNNENDNINEF